MFSPFRTAFFMPFFVILGLKPGILGQPTQNLQSGETFCLIYQHCKSCKLASPFALEGTRNIVMKILDFHSSFLLLEDRFSHRKRKVCNNFPPYRFHILPSMWISVAQTMLSRGKRTPETSGTDEKQGRRRRHME